MLFLNLGCKERETKVSRARIDREKVSYALLIVADIAVIEDDPRAYEYVLRAIDKYASDRTGEPDTVTISQISGNNRPILFRGTPRQLREKMPDQEQFRDYLVSRSDKGRRLNQGLVESFDFILNTHDVHEGKAQPVALIISSMEAGENEPPGSDEKMIDKLIEFHKAGGFMAFYFCAQERMAWVREQTKKAGMEWTTIEATEEYSDLPTFD